MWRRCFFACWLALPLLAQQLPIRLDVVGDLAQPLSFTQKDLATLPRASVQFADHDGKPATYQGVWLYDILRRAGIPQGKELRGTAFAAYIVAEAHDGYRVVFSLGELDPDLTGQRILVADQVDGQPLPPNRGPLRLVIPSDRRPARSVRMLTRIHFVRLQDR
jgi:DMSO/TMAO reductase YedYZ molybdopterin-dependent catalytic subunit